MIAKIGRGVNIYGVLAYNQVKVNNENGQILLLHKMIETPDSKYSVAQLIKSFEPYLTANRNTEKPVLHISLNPDPADKVSDDKYKLMAEAYMKEMGYGEQPFIVFKHTDIERIHIHIVSVCIDEEGRKIADSFERKRSMNVCRALERKYHLVPATDQKRQNDDRIFQPVNYKKGDIKSQLASVVRHMPNHYQCQSLGAYNALLSLFNITVEEVKGELNRQPKHGLVYFALNEQGEKSSNPFKSSLFGKHAGIQELQKHFDQSKEQMKVHPAKAAIINIIETAMYPACNETDFKKQLVEQGINIVVRCNREGRIYGITFIDHNSRMVWNGSQLGKHISANAFNELWKEAGLAKEDYSVQKVDKAVNMPGVDQSETIVKEMQQPHKLFDFLNSDKTEETPGSFVLVEGIGGILPEVQGEDFEELAFARQMKGRKRNGKKR